MTVQELIDALEKVENKALPVYDFTKDLITLVVLEKDLSDGETFVTIKAG